MFRFFETEFIAFLLDVSRCSFGFLVKSNSSSTNNRKLLIKILIRETMAMGLVVVKENCVAQFRKAQKANLTR